MPYNLFDYGSECAEIFVTVNLGTESDFYGQGSESDITSVRNSARFKYKLMGFIVYF
jgi:hypothetical protein